MKINDILKKQASRIKLNEQELKDIEEKTKDFCEKLKEKLEKKKIKADVFIGGSLAKKTILKREKYDVDIFVRFDSKYKDEEISDLLGKCLKASRIHGSRDYFKVNQGKVDFEIVPVIKISKPSDARNVTDLSFFHVSYVRKCLKKNKKLADEIVLAKAFCFANNVYGAESYIRGFSGYALELLICYYKSFVNFLKATVNSKEQIVLDPKKWYKNKDNILLNINEAKLSSPIVFVDPTNKERNALAALSFDTFNNFKKIAGKFLKKPSLIFFEEKKIREKNFNFVLKARTNKQEGDVAGSKLLKFYNFLSGRLEKYFIISKKNFVYNKKAWYYFKIKSRKELIISGPPITSLENVVAFKKKHKNVFIKNNRVYAREKVKIKAENMIKSKEIKKIMKDMGIIRLGVK